MEHLRQLPSKALAPYVEHYWLLNFYIPPGAQWRQAMIPSLIQGLFFVFDGCNQVPNEQKIITVSPKHFVAGQLSGPNQSIFSGNTQAFGVRLHPTAFFRLFGVPLSFFTDCVIDLTAVIGPAADQLYEQLKEANNFNVQIQLMEQFLFRRLLAGFNPADRVAEINYAVQRIHQLNGQVNINRLCQETNLSIRSFERHFLEKTGLTAKSFARVARFNTAIRLIESSKIDSHQDVLHHLGYYDQAHFIKDFRQLSGRTPNEYFAGNLAFDSFFLIE